ncbi:hypothetical protein M2447_002032 [Ereboglobus sp. PH5-10]|uniref:hypothetical protein n=1 Tax=Ereboglobus sp. PH5-10 TaxID=2940629 RepID=UPI0024075424|nr:hypothetical protein [Ereboglobus sp. PH5-10]MDF9827927.1 hypothetical protein [Ereboglobus sp. PH5-10]
MTPENLFHQLLGLGDEWRVSRCEFEAEQGEVNLWVEELPHFWVVESARQKQRVRIYDYTKELEWRHLNVFEHHCVLRCQLPRGRREDGSVYRVIRTSGLMRDGSGRLNHFLLLLPTLQYILLYKPTADAKKPFVAGLVDVETLRKKYAASTPESASVTAANAASVKPKANGREAMPHPHTDDTSTPKPTNTALAAPHTNGKAASKIELQTTPKPRMRRSKNTNDKNQTDFGLCFGDASGGLFDRT